MSTNLRLYNTDDLLIEEYNRRGILKKEIRSYEVSLWTLLDDFITVLKWSDVEQKGRIENPKLTLNIDGTEKFTFSIPMAYRNENGKLIDNPNWYSVSNGKIIRGLHKVKVILNKSTSEEAVFELVIINITEDHEHDIKTCNVETEGLAFLELGKIGYKINLSTEDFENDYAEWEKNGKWINNKGEECNYKPAQSIDYWCQEGCGIYPLTGNTPLSSKTWYYKVLLNHYSYEGSTERESGKIYEEPYAISWDENMQPTSIESWQEKLRPMSAENSNLYNITLDLAKTFGVFCRYEYGHDENYHINSRTIIFYNNFMLEDLGTLSIVYPYSAARTERHIECADVTTKLYVLSTDNDAILSGESTIMDAKPNYSGEDYILNFDYMKEIGATPEDVDTIIKQYLLLMHDYNLDLKIALRELEVFENEKIELEAKKTVAENSIKLDQETILLNLKFINAISAKDSVPNDNYFAKEGANCDSAIILVDDKNLLYINLTTTYKGIIENTVLIFTKIASGVPDVNYKITDFEFRHDDYTNVTHIYFLSPITVDYNRVYLTYHYDPQLYYLNIINTWLIKLNKDESNLRDYLRNLGPESTTDDKYELSTAYPNNEKTLELAYNVGLNKLILDRKDLIENTIREKKEAIAAFEHCMGPNIREGYWQPEDYKDYGDKYQYSSTLPSTDPASLFVNHFNNQQEISYVWDSVLFDDELELYYEIGINLNREIYPCIDLYTLYGNNIPTDLNTYSIVWKANNLVENNNYSSIKDLGIMAVGSLALIRFAAITNSGTTVVHPVLVLEGAKTFSPDLLERLIIDGGARLEKYSITNVNGTMTATHTNVVSLTNAWLCYRTFNTKPEGWSDALYNKYLVSLDPVGKIRAVYPRINCSSLLLKTDSTNLIIKYGALTLETIEDYYINTKYITRFASTGYLEYFITLKPETLIKCNYLLDKEVSIYYILSNANTEIYLDALKISKENAKPKVSYSVSISALNTNLMHDLYRHLAHIVLISDSDLKFENVFGYISNLELDLDKPWEDLIEIKNYTSKFEDLFSSIVALAEEMRRNEGAMSAMLAGTSPLGESGLEKTLYMNDLILSAYLDSYFDSSEVVKQKLADLFDEASKILASSLKSLNEIASLSEENAGILLGFVLNVTAELTPEVFRLSTRPNEFKVGDIWILIDNNGEEVARYIATANSSDLNPSSSPTAGFVRTSDGSLALIKGAKIDIDSEAGKIDIEAETELNLKAGAEGAVNIAAGLDVNITGERSVNIGGTTINIGSTTINNTTVTGGINLVAAAYNASNFTGINASKVLISPTRIEMGAAELTMKSASTINMFASLGAAANTSAIKLDANSGIWIGSGKSISLFSGTNTTGSNVLLTPTRIIMGVNNDSSLSVFELKPAYLLMAVGTTGSDFSSSDVNINSSSSITGMKLTKDSFGLAIGSGNNRTAIIANSSGITVGTGDTPVTSGSYVNITGSGVEIGSLGNLYINMNNFKLLTNNGLGTRFAVGYNLQYITQDSTVSGLIANSAPTMENNTWVGLVFTNNNLYVNGNIYAKSFILAPDVTIPLSGVSGLDARISGIKNQILYYLTNSTSNTVSSPSALVTNQSETAYKTWTLTRPIYPSRNSTAWAANTSYAVGALISYNEIGYICITANSDSTFTSSHWSSGPFYYYTCILTKVNTSSYAWSSPELDYGVSNAAASASIARGITDAFTANGLLSNYLWGGAIWKIALTGTENLLIGANDTILIAKPGVSSVSLTLSNGWYSGAAIAIDSSGIAMDAASIYLKSTDANNNTNIISLGNNGISLGTGGHIFMETYNPLNTDSLNYIRMLSKSSTTDNGGTTYLRSLFDVFPSHIFFGNIITDSTYTLDNGGFCTWFNNSGMLLEEIVSLNNKHLILNVSKNGFYLDINTTVHERGNPTVEKTSHNILHIKAEPDTYDTNNNLVEGLTGFFYRTLDYYLDNLNHSHATDTFTYISSNYFSITHRDTDMTGSTANKGCTLFLLKFNELGLGIYKGGTIVNTNATYWRDTWSFNAIEPLLEVTYDGIKTPKLRIDHGSFNLISANACVGFSADSASAGAVPFFINMPPNSPNNNTNDIKLAFWYSEGTVYIRNLVYLNSTLGTAALFGDSGNVSTGTGGSAGVSNDIATATVCSDCTGGCFYSCTGGCDRDCTGRCVNTCTSGCTGSCGGISSAPGPLA